MKNNSRLLLIVFGSAILSFTTPAQAIKKCQDANGKWHYGDVATDVCDNSEVTTLNDRGFITDQVAAPKTEEELRIEQELQATEEAERLRVKQEEDERIRILSIYETEEDIDRQRDNQLSSVQGNILVHEAYLKNMATRIERMQREQAEVTAAKRKQQLGTEIEQANARVDASTIELAQLEQQKTDIIEKFKREKEVYLALKNTQ